MRSTITALCLLLAVPSTSLAAEYYLEADDWARPRSGEAVRQMPGLREATREWMSSSGAVLTIRYAGGDDGTLWAEEVRDWLVALGIASSALRVEPGGSDEGRLELVVTSGAAAGRP